MAGAGGVFGAGHKAYRPLFGFGPGDRPHSVHVLVFRLPHVEGDGAPPRRTAWIARPDMARPRPGPGREASRPAPCGAPTRHLRLTPLSAIGPYQELSVPGRFVPRPPVGQGCVKARPQVPLPLPALRTPPEGAPRLRIGMGHSIVTLSVKSTAISLLVYEW